MEIKATEIPDDFNMSLIDGRGENYNHEKMPRAILVLVSAQNGYRHTCKMIKLPLKRCLETNVQFCQGLQSFFILYVLRIK